MRREEMMVRLGLYCGTAARLLGDASYAERFIGRAETVTEEQYLATVAEINERLIAAGHLQPDEDLWITVMLS